MEFCLHKDRVKSLKPKIFGIEMREKERELNKSRTAP